MYPNPSSQTVFVSAELDNYANLRVVVADLLGREVIEVYSGTTLSIHESFDVSGLVDGTYNVSYLIDGGIVKSELLLVK